MNETLAQFLREKNQKAEEQPQVDWEARRQQWVESLSALYQMIDGWLSELKADGTVTITFEKKNIERGTHRSV